MAEVVTQLQQIGFGEYEARAYAALLQRSPLNGYELAKASGVPRANVYAVLRKLEERGAVARVDTPDGARYTPVPPQELLDRLGNRFQDSLDEARQSLEAIVRPVEPEYVWNAQGYPALLEHARALVDHTQNRLMLAVWPEESRALAENTARAEARGVDITTLCLAGCAAECGACRGRVHRYPVEPESAARWLVVVPDGEEVLAGEIRPDASAAAVRTRQRLLVDLAMGYIRRSIALAAMLTDLGGKLETMLAPETRDILDSIGPAGQEGGWLDAMRQLLARRQDETSR